MGTGMGKGGLGVRRMKGANVLQSSALLLGAVGCCWGSSLPAFSMTFQPVYGWVSFRLMVEAGEMGGEGRQGRHERHDRVCSAILCT